MLRTLTYLARLRALTPISAFQHAVTLHHPTPARSLHMTGSLHASDTPSTADDDTTAPFVPPYRARAGEGIEVLRARLLYQSRKRGTLENGLLLSTFASKKLYALSVEQLFMYDKIINEPTNDWDIYSWIVGSKDVPEEYDNAVMTMLKEHARNSENELRISQPPLQS